MALEHLVETYGYLALFLGVIMEGETILVLAGFMASQGHLNLYWVIAVAFVGTFLTDQFFFFLGRLKGKSYIENRPHWHKRTKKLNLLLGKYQTLIVLGFRFMYGLRTITPLMIGASDVKIRTFVLLNLLGGIIWTLIIGGGGYLFGHTIEIIFDHVKKYEKWGLIIIILVWLLIWSFRFYKNRKNSQPN